jgi:hypothetical protein
MYVFHVEPSWKPKYVEPRNKPDAPVVGGLFISPSEFVKILASKFVVVTVNDEDNVTLAK